MDKGAFYQIILLITILASSVFAQTLPDAGRTLLEQTQKPSQLPEKGVDIDIKSPSESTTETGGAKVTIESVNIEGVTVFGVDELIRALGDFSGKSYDLAGLRQLADKISEYYRKNGYPFVRAIIPPQSIKDGRLTIEVVEGRFGKVSTRGKEPLAQKALAFLSPLKQGDVITSTSLERTTLILSDQPGVKVVPILKPGDGKGIGDLDVNVEPSKKVNFELGADNYGNRYSGEYRGYANLKINSPFTLGDQIVVNVSHSNKKLWMGGAEYNLPIGISGLRGKIGYSQTYYELGEEFSALDASGIAKVSYLGLSYPIIRSKRANLTIDTTWQYKYLKDKQGSTNTDNSKHSNVLPVTLSFDRYDGFLGGGVTYGSVVYTHGFLELDNESKNYDIQSGMDARGNFDKVNIDISRIQSMLIPNLTVFGRVYYQWAGKNLDSSEGFILGGPNGVRAYPVGEGAGDDGVLGQVELRYLVSYFIPYLFYDVGNVKYNRNNDVNTPKDPNYKTISGWGIGLRVNHDFVNANLSLAWRTDDDKPESDTKDRKPRVWANVSIKF